MKRNPEGAAVKIKDIASKLGAEIKVGGDLEKEVCGCYVSDLLSDVLANSKEGEIWVTHQSHPNVIAVASVRGLAGVVITGNRGIDADTLSKAEAEQVTILKSNRSTFEIAGEVYKLLS